MSILGKERQVDWEVVYEGANGLLDLYKEDPESKGMMFSLFFNSCAAITAELKVPDNFAVTCKDNIVSPAWAIRL